MELLASIGDKKRRNNHNSCVRVHLFLSFPLSETHKVVLAKGKINGRACTHDGMRASEVMTLLDLDLDHFHSPTAQWRGGCKRAFALHKDLVIVYYEKQEREREMRLCRKVHFSRTRFFCAIARVGVVSWSRAFARLKSATCQVIDFLCLGSA